MIHIYKTYFYQEKKMIIFSVTYICNGTFIMSSADMSGMNWDGTKRYAFTHRQ